MSALLDKKIVTKLNSKWQAFEQLTVRDAVTMLCSERNGEKPGFAMDFVTVKKPDGTSSLEYANPVSWDEWMLLPIRAHDLVIETSRGPIRVPLIVICANYDKLPFKTPKLGKDAILRRDNYTCQYSGEKLSKHDLNVDHVLPRDRGGRDSWDNLVASRKDINFAKGNKTNREAGLKLIRQPVAPKATVKMVRAEDLPDEIRDEVRPFVLS